ncbi:MAG: hypothetical protein WB682_12625 [Candidatus Dormiibacterota bacterium]
MSSPGLSHERLARMRSVLAGYVERGEVPGWSAWSAGEAMLTSR